MRRLASHYFVILSLHLVSKVAWVASLRPDGVWLALVRMVMVQLVQFAPVVQISIRLAAKIVHNERSPCILRDGDI